jgi:hypothetical protein
MRTGFSFSAPTSIAPSIRQTISLSLTERPHRSVPRIPAVTVEIRNFEVSRARLRQHVGRESECTGENVEHSPEEAAAFRDEIEQLQLAFRPSLRMLPSASLM